jgi:hypothetical protein
MWHCTSLCDSAKLKITTCGFLYVALYVLFSEHLCHM